MRRILAVGLLSVVLILCLFGECVSLREAGLTRWILSGVDAACKDAGTQWMVFVCGAVYLVTFGLLRGRLGGGAARGERGGCSAEGGDSVYRAMSDRESRGGWAQGMRRRFSDAWCGTLWLVLLMTLAGAAYALDYMPAAHSPQAVVLLGGAVLGQGAGFFGEKLKTKGQRLKPPAYRVIAALVVLLVAGAVWQTETGQVFQYRGQARWSGPWDNPNTFGVLMGAGAVLAVGSLKSKVQSPKSKAVCVFLIGVALVMGFGLVRSYSRGAWVGAMAGLAYLAWGSSRDRRRQMANGKAAANGKLWGVVAAVSALVLVFWGLRGTPGLVARRAYSVANANDFSWRNRVAAYEGALAMVAARPWFGFGWNQPEKVYTTLYCPAKVQEGMAVQLNDYFMLGMTLGIPALACFAVYLWLALGPRLPIANGRWQMGDGEWVKAACRAGAVVLAVGFWFDGGLFKLATGATFWILLELGRE